MGRKSKAKVPKKSVRHRVSGNGHQKEEDSLHWNTVLFPKKGHEERLAGIRPFWRGLSEEARQELLTIKLSELQTKAKLVDKAQDEVFDLGKTNLTVKASVIVILVVSQIAYGLLGAFGAARHGLSTNGNVMVNSWLPPKAQGVLELVMSAYLATSIPPISLSLQSTLHCLLVGEHAVYEPVRHYLITSVPLFAALAIALLFPQASEKVFAVTGATGVMLICYLLPVVLHLMLRRQRMQNLKRRADTGGPLLQGEQSAITVEEEGLRFWCWEWATQVAVPILLAVIGVGISVAALVIAVKDLTSS